MITDTQNEILMMVERWARRELPLLNRSTEAHGDIQFLINSTRIRVEAIAHATRDIRDPRTAMSFLQILGLAVSSVERHLQAAGTDPGEGVDALQAAPVLMRLGEVAGHAPRDSHDTYWSLNRGDIPLMFIGSSEEATFIRTMNEMNHLQSDSAAMLRPVCSGELPVTSRMAVDAMKSAAGSHDRLSMLLYSIVAPRADRRWSGTRFEMFARTLGMYLVDYPVGMQTYLAPDPANLIAPMEMELVVGPRDGYCDEIRQRMPLLMQSDRLRIDAAMKMPSLGIRIAQAAGLAEHELVTMPAERVADIIAAQPCVRTAVAAFAGLARSLEASASYFAVIQQAFRPAASPVEQSLSTVKTLAQRDDDRYATLPQVTPSRQTHPAVQRLIAAANA